MPEKTLREWEDETFSPEFNLEAAREYIETQREVIAELRAKVAELEEGIPDFVGHPEETEMLLRGSRKRVSQLATELREEQVHADTLAEQLEQIRKLAFDSDSFVIDCALQSESPKQPEMARIYHTDARGKGFYKIDKDKFDAILNRKDRASFHPENE